MIEPNMKNWNHRWLRDGVEYISKTEAMKEFKLSKEEFAALLIRAYKEDLQLRYKTFQNSRYSNYFTVYSVEDLKEILGLNHPVT